MSNSLLLNVHSGSHNPEMQGCRDRLSTLYYREDTCELMVGCRTCGHVSGSCSVTAGPGHFAAWLNDLGVDLLQATLLMLRGAPFERAVFQVGRPR